MSVHLESKKPDMNNTKIKSRADAQSRFDTRLTRRQKDLFEEAARIKGYKSLSEFVIHTLVEVSTPIIERHNAILASEKDKTIFFDALANPRKPNKALTKATKDYQSQRSVK